MINWNWHKIRTAGRSRSSGRHLVREQATDVTRVAIKIDMYTGFMTLFVQQFVPPQKRSSVPCLSEKDKIPITAPLQVSNSR
jgi:hypothetical protein